MADPRNRYPGAQPFSDEDFSRKVFFGRENAARLLTDKILANHVVTVYARSGLGKTSLLQAGVAPRLRDDGYLPLFVRVNDVRRGPFRALLETIPGEAKRQHIEYVPGRPDSLWSFFKTAEFWREDLLLTPVLILDQFEELFTLQSEKARAHLLNELSYLVRGVPPPHGQEPPPAEGLNEKPPAVHLVLSLREDYLGFLEEASEHIPQILDARFRLAPLDRQAAEEAIVGPAAITDPDLETRPFALDRTAITTILDYLSHARTPIVSETRRYVEPFQLQLICRRMEQIADAWQKASGVDLTISMADLGGEVGLTHILRDFYLEAINSLPDRRGRRRSRRLCEKFLISPEGRRLSLEENEIRRQVHLPRETLDQLVASRLLRSDNRSESTYYELSHDALVAPVLAFGHIRAQAVGMLGMVAGALLIVLSVVFLVGAVVAEATDPSKFDLGDAIALTIGVAFGLAIVVPSVMVLRRSARSMMRYRRAREPAMADTEVRDRSGVLAGLSAVVGGATAALAGLIWLSGFAVIVVGPVGGPARRFAEELDLGNFVDHRIAHGIGLDTLVYLVGATAMVTAGLRLCRWGVYRLAGTTSRRTVPAPPWTGRRAVLYAASRMLIGGILLLSAVMLVGLAVLTVQCGTLARGSMPGSLPAAWFNLIAVNCEAGYPNGIGGPLVADFVLLTALLFVAIPTLRRGIAATRQVISRLSGKSAITRTESAEQFS